MRAAAIFGPGASSRDLKPFQAAQDTTWQTDLPTSRNAADVMLIFGGDGTIHRHLTRLVELQRPVLIVPTGSGNDFARSIGLRSVRHALAAWRAFLASRANVQAVDLGIVADGAAQRYFCCVAGVGLDAEAQRRANNFPRWLRANGGYALALLPALFQFAPVPTTIEIPSTSGGWAARSNQPILLAAFANTPYYGGGMKIAPRAQMNDGLLDACVIAAMHPLKLFCLFPTVYSGRHLAVREVDYFQTSAVRIEPDPPLDVYADGEFVCRSPVEISVARSALTVITAPG